MYFCILVEPTKLDAFAQKLFKHGSEPIVKIKSYRPYRQYNKNYFVYFEDDAVAMVTV